MEFLDLYGESQTSDNRKVIIRCCWSSVFDLESLAIYRAEGDPRKKGFVSDYRLQHRI